MGRGGEGDGQDKRGLLLAICAARCARMGLGSNVVDGGARRHLCVRGGWKTTWLQGAVAACAGWSWQHQRARATGAPGTSAILVEMRAKGFLGPLLSSLQIPLGTKDAAATVASAVLRFLSLVPEFVEQFMGGFGAEAAGVAGGHGAAPHGLQTQVGTLALGGCVEPAGDAGL